MTNIETIKSYSEKVIKQNYDFDYVGIRVQEELNNTTIGQELNHNSSIWIDGTETEEKLNGISAINAKTAKNLNYVGGYFGKHILVLGSNSFQYGEDPEEIIMQNPIVLDIYYNND